MDNETNEVYLIEKSCQVPFMVRNSLSIHNIFDWNDNTQIIWLPGTFCFVSIIFILNHSLA